MIGLAGIKGSIQNLIISFDHRVSDGLEIANLINDTLLKLRDEYPSIIDENSCHQCLKTIHEEEEVGSPGLIRILGYDKNLKYVCRSCFNGW